MAAVNVTISGMLYDKLNKTTQNVALIGEAFLTDLTIGGGPVIPPPSEGPKPPLGIWGPTDPRPTPPIAFPPGWVGGVPPGGWPGDPPPDVTPAPPEMAVKPPPDQGGWAYVQPWGWGYFPGTSGMQPHK